MGSCATLALPTPRMDAGRNIRRLTPMFMFPARFAFVSALLLPCLGATGADAMDVGRTAAAAQASPAQAAPVQYWTPGWPAGFSDAATGQGVDAYGNFP